MRPMLVRAERNVSGVQRTLRILLVGANTVAHGAALRAAGHRVVGNRSGVRLAQWHGQADLLVAAVHNSTETRQLSRDLGVGCRVPALVFGERSLIANEPTLLRRVDDFLVRPGPAALVRHIERAWLGTRSTPPVRLAHGIVDFEAGTLRRADEAVRLGARELSVLKALVDGGRAMTRSQLIDALGVDAAPRTVDVWIRRLRMQIEPDPTTPIHLSTMRRAGYRFNPVRRPLRAPESPADASHVSTVSRWLAGSERLGAVVGREGAGKSAAVASALRNGLATGTVNSAWWCDLEGTSRDLDGVITRLSDRVGVSSWEGASNRDRVRQLGSTMDFQGGGVLVLDHADGAGLRLARCLTQLCSRVRILLVSRSVPSGIPAMPLAGAARPEPRERALARAQGEAATAAEQPWSERSLNRESSSIAAELAEEGKLVQAEAAVRFEIERHAGRGDLHRHAKSLLLLAEILWSRRCPDAASAALVAARTSAESARDADTLNAAVGMHAAWDNERRATDCTAGKHGGLCAHAAGTWFEVGATRVDLSRRVVLARVLARLIEARRTAPGHAVTGTELVAAGWPGERIIPMAARHRLHVAIATLRKMGLTDVLVTTRGGYLLSADEAVCAHG
jgi:DNA-binding winged helix-turn-helix (wHTH) protein